MININMKNFNIFTIISVVLFLIGIIFYIYWGLRFGVWADIGIYSVTIFLVLSGLIGTVLSLYEKPEKTT